jgi:hypothetical protein
MKIFLIVILFTFSALAQNPSSRVASACGPQGASFDVTLDNSQPTIAQPLLDKAQVYFIQDEGAKSLGFGGTVVSMIGIDGQWVGGNKNSSYFSVLVEQGEHHLCAKVQSHSGHPIELAHFIAEPGKIYYFREKIIPTDTSFGNYLFLSLVDSDEARYLINSYPLSVSQPKK